MGRKKFHKRCLQGVNNIFQSLDESCPDAIWEGEDYMDASLLEEFSEESNEEGATYVQPYM